MIFPKSEKFHFREIPRIARLAIVTFFMMLAYSLIGTIWSIYIKSFVGTDSSVGFIISFLTIISILSYIFTIPIIEKYNKSTIFKIIIFVLAICYSILAFNKSLYGFLGISVLITCLSTLRINAFGLIIKENSSKKNISKSEGLIYTFLNAAWLIGPIIAGLIAATFGTNSIFIFASALFIITLLLFSLSGVTGLNTLKKIDRNGLKNVIHFFKNKDRTISYILGGGVNFWWILLYVFMPLYIIGQGFNAEVVGYFLFAVAIPLLLLEYSFSKLIGKIKYKTLFKLGYLIPAVCALIAFFASNNNLIFGALIFASIGLAMIEPTTEAYFLRIMKNQQELKYYEIYNTSIDINLLLAALFSSTFLIFFPFKMLFLLFGSFMFFFFLLSFKTKEI